MRRWSWGPIPVRLNTDPRVMALSRPTRAVLYALYAGADEHGLFCAEEMALRASLGFLDGQPVFPAVAECANAGLVHLYVNRGQVYGVIDRYDEDADAKTSASRPKPSHPLPPADTWRAAGCTGAYRTGRGGKTECLAEPNRESTRWTREEHGRSTGGAREVHRRSTGGPPETPPVDTGGTREVNGRHLRWTREVHPTPQVAETTCSPPVDLRWTREVNGRSTGGVLPDPTRPDPTLS